MNTVKNPLILSRVDEPCYIAQKTGNHSGYYIDLSLAEEMLEALENAHKLLRSVNGQLYPEWEEAKYFESIISKAKG